MTRALRFAAAAVLLAALSAALSLPADAQEVRVERIEIVQSGFMLSPRRTGKTTDAPGTATGTVIEATSPAFLRDPPADTARVGTMFGVRFYAVGKPVGGEVKLRSVWKIPAPGITNPKTGKTHLEDVTEFSTRIGDLHARAYGFDEEWEIARGTWTIELWQGDRKLLEQSFAIR